MFLLVEYIEIIIFCCSRKVKVKKDLFEYPDDSSTST